MKLPLTFALFLNAPIVWAMEPILPHGDMGAVTHPDLGQITTPVAPHPPQPQQYLSR
jgi:hypothetical protein